ncbi:MAG TPA: 2'-5' RNA ligase family protein [Candidatus Diapherotrites archaeon]|nr:2'-5' RNA ligase family protein [Candidatus Diapherotrites archaeon]
MKFISLYELINEEIKKEKKSDYKDNSEDVKYGCVMMDAEIDNWDEDHLSIFDKDDIYTDPSDGSYRLEYNPHVTVVYGIHEDEVDPEDVKNFIKEKMEPLTVKIEEIDIFENPEYDVVKYNVPINKQLEKYRKLFLQFPNTQNYPEYNPHITLEYLLPGRGFKYKRKIKKPFYVTFTKGVYSWHNPDDPNELKRKEVDLEEKRKKKVE